MTIAVDYVNLKQDIINLIEDAIIPIQSQVSSSISLHNNTISQDFYPFTTKLNSLSLYVANNIGSPNKINIDIIKDNKVLKTVSIPPNIGWNTVKLDLEVNSQLLYTTRIRQTTDASNYSYIGVGPYTNYYYSNYNKQYDIACKFIMDDYILGVYPYLWLERGKLPIIIVDVVGRTRVRDLTLSGKSLYEDLMLRIDIYSRYPNEVDRIGSGIEYYLLHKRTSIANMYLIPSVVSNIGIIAEYIFFRSINFIGRIFISVP